MDADHWPRAYLRAELIERGWEAIGFVSLRDAVARLVHDGAGRPAAAAPSLIWVDLRGLGASNRQLDTLFAAGVPLLAVGGSTEWADERLADRPWSARLRLPLTIGAIADAIERIAQAGRMDAPAPAPS